MNDTLNQKKYAYMAGIVLAVMLVLFVGAKIAETLKGYGYIGQGTYPATTVSFTGDGEVFVKPDLGVFTFTVTKEAKTVAEATKTVNEKVAKVLASLKAFGIEEKDLKNQNYNLSPQYDYDYVDCAGYVGCKRSVQVFRGYQVTQTIEVKVRDIDKVGEALDVVAKADVKEVGNLSLQVENRDVALAEAREEAIKEAKEKATELAKTLGVDLVRIVSFNEYNNNPIMYARDYAYGKGGMESSVAPAPSIPAGENSVTSNVTITYEIR